MFGKVAAWPESHATNYQISDRSLASPLLQAEAVVRFLDLHPDPGEIAESSSFARGQKVRKQLFERGFGCAQPSSR